MDYRRLAERSGLPPLTVHRYLAGKRDMTSAKCDLLLRALDVLIAHHKAHTEFIAAKRAWLRDERRSGPSGKGSRRQ